MQVLVFNSYFYPTLEKMKKLRHVVLHGVCDNQVRYNASHSFSDNWGGGGHMVQVSDNQVRHMVRSVTTRRATWYGSAVIV
jgi:hypothetical protein